MKYTVSCPQPTTHFLEFTLQINDIREDKLLLQLSSWRPGKYSLQDFAKNIFKMEALDQNGAPLPLTKITKDQWQVLTLEATAVTLRYRYLAVQMDAGGSWADEHQVYINWVNCGLLVEGREQEPIDIELNVPSDYEVATSLTAENGILTAANYDELVDSPLIASPSLAHKIYQVGEYAFHIWVQGRCSIDWEKVIHDFRRFSEAQIAAFGGFPCQEYHFLIQALPYRHYHGVEHQKSTVLTLGPSEQLMDELYDDLLGVSSHELYHTWNVTRLRPKELLPYRWDTYTYFETGFVAEGITTYYGDLMLCRSGVWDETQYLKEFAVFLKRHFDNPARLEATLSDSSFDLWLDGYSPRQPKRKVSIYVKGALIAFILDMRIRQASNGEQGLDEFMNRLWGKHLATGYSIEDYQANIEHYLGKEAAQEYMETFVQGSDDLYPFLLEAMGWLGLEMRAEQKEGNFTRQYGCKLTYASHTHKVVAIAPQSPAADMLSIGDEIIAVNGRKVGPNIDELLRLKQEAVVEVTLFRKNELMHVEMNTDETQYFQSYVVQRVAAIGEEQQSRIKGWLSSK